MEPEINTEVLAKAVFQLQKQVKALTKHQEESEKDKSAKEETYSQNTVKALKEEISLLKSEHQEKIEALESKFKQENIELREDLLKLLQKFESKFNSTDSDIDVLKAKCELQNCICCDYQSFKIHFFACGACSGVVCSSCLTSCLACGTTKCQSCLVKCNKCQVFHCQECLFSCDCNQFSCKTCYQECYSCEQRSCSLCMNKCRACDRSYCVKCATACEKCDEAVICKECFKENEKLERCYCGTIYCFECENTCSRCVLPLVWENGSRLCSGFHVKTAEPLAKNTIVVMKIATKGIDTTHLGLTTDKEFRATDRPTENFWSLVLNSGEKFSTADYKKKGEGWSSYAKTVQEGDVVELVYGEKDVKYRINRKDYGVAFNLGSKDSHFLYCLTHDDSTEVTIKSSKMLK